MNAVLSKAAVSKDEFAFLQSIDTPTVCNLIEIAAPERTVALPGQVS